MTKVSTISGINRIIALQGNTHKMEKLKLGMRIWSGFTKFIRSQCAKERVIDSIYFGTFYKQDDSYQFINTFSEENAEYPDKEFTTLNIQGIAEVCNCSVEMV
jgi:uncharacterized membrane protein YkgB